MGDWTGLAFFVVLSIGVIIFLKVISRPQNRTTADFERRISEGPTALGASMNALQELLNPEAAKGKEVQVQMIERRDDQGGVSGLFKD